MNTKRYKIALSDEERDIANKIVSENSEDSKVILRAKILLLSDSSNAPELSIMQIAEAAGTSKQTVTKIRSICHEQGFHIALRVLDRKGTATEVTAFSIITDYQKGIKYPIADFEITPLEDTWH